MKGHAILLEDYKVKVIEESVEGTIEKIMDLKEFNENYSFTIEKEDLDKNINI